jgi:hypothetical protein
MKYLITLFFLLMPIVCFSDIGGAGVDLEVKALTIIDTVHASVHKGTTFAVSDVITSLSNNASYYFTISVAKDCDVHMFSEIASGGSGRINIYESPTFVDGVELPKYNLDRNVTDITTCVTVSTNSVISSPGTSVFTQYIAGGTGGSKQGSTFRQGTEWVLGEDKKYSIVFTNTSGQSVGASIGLQWYEID